MGFLKSADNFINDMVFGTCSRPFYIYVTTFIPAFIGAALMLRFFDFDDMTRAAASSAASEGGPGRRRGKHGRSKKGKALPKGTPGRGYRTALQHLLFITEPLEKIGFGLLVWGAVDQFYANWMMWLDDADACIDAGFFAPEHRASTNGIATPNNEGGAIPMSDLIQDNSQMFSNAFGSSVPLGRLQAILAVTFKGPFPGGVPYKIRLHARGVIGSGVFESGTATTAFDQETTLIVSADMFFPFPSGGTIVWEMVGPPVPVGIQVVKADVILQRRQHAFG